MYCPKCQCKLNCQDSKPLDDTKRCVMRRRVYKCSKCKKQYLSIEELDTEPLPRRK